MKILNLKTNYNIDPIGIDTTPKFSWQMSAKDNKFTQLAYRIGISTDIKNLKKNIFDIWDSKKTDSKESIQIKYEGAKLLPRTKYYWLVEVYDNKGFSTQSDVAFFETGKLDEKWEGNWITAKFLQRKNLANQAPYIRKTFDLKDNIKDARLYICGVGYFKAYINGNDVADEFLSTPFTKYDKTLLYSSYDITKLVDSGKNAFGTVLGNGWFNPEVDDPWNTKQVSWRDVPKMICEIHIEYKDGTKEKIKSDTSFKAIKSPITYNSIRNGEYYDANLEVDMWNDKNCDDALFAGTRITQSPGGSLFANEMQPIRATKVLTPAKQWRGPRGEFIYDIGQNMAGIVRLKIKGNKYSNVTIKYAERLDAKNEKPDQASIKGFIKSGEFQTDKYIKKSDDEETWNPIFVYHGFQYVEITITGTSPRLLEAPVLEALVLTTDFKKTANFECSDDTINKVYDMAYWSSISNFHGIPTDCPHREKNAWTGDGAVSAEQFVISFNSQQAFSKWMRDYKDAQRNSGAIPCVVPSTGWGYTGMNGPDWSAGLINIPWLLYLYSKDTSILEETFDMMKSNCMFMLSMADNYLVEYGLGDWCVPFTGPALSINMGSSKAPREVTDSAYFYVGALTIAKVAKILNNIEDEEYYTELANNIKKSIREKYIDTNYLLDKCLCQTTLGCLMFQGIIDSEEFDKYGEILVEEVVKKDNHLDFGILGHKYVMNTLGELGEIELAIKMITNDTFPSFKHWIDMGANTLWECWNGGGSRNHHMFSDIAAFMYKYIGGIKVDVNDPGFQHVIIRPAVNCGLEFANTNCESMYGNIVCNWTKEEVNIEIPIGSNATLILPNRDNQELESGIYTIKL